MAMTKEQLLEQMEMDQMIAQAEMAGDPYIQDDRVQLSAGPEGTGDNMYRDMGAIDPSQMNTGAGDMGGIEPENISNEELMMAEEFMNSLPPKEKKGFMDLFMAKPREALNAVMDTLRQVFDREEEEGYVPDQYISYDSEGNATIGQRSIAKSSGPATAFRGTDLYSDYRSYPDTVRGRDNIKRRIDMDMGQPVVPRRIVDGGEYEDYNDPENDAIFDRGKLERGRFQQQEMDGRLGSLSGIIKGAMSDNEKGFAMSTALPQGLTDEEFQSFMDKKYAAQKRMKEQMLNNR